MLNLSPHSNTWHLKLKNTLLVFVLGEKKKNDKVSHRAPSIGWARSLFEEKV